MSHQGFTLKIKTWFAVEFIGDEFFYFGRYRYSPIDVQHITPARTGDRRFTLSFYHAHDPEGVRDTVYESQTLERGGQFHLARCYERQPVRIMHMFEIDWDWLIDRFGLRGVDQKENVTRNSSFNR